MTSRGEREDEAGDDGGDFCVSLQQIEVMQIFLADGSALEAETIKKTPRMEPEMLLWGLGVSSQREAYESPVVFTFLAQKCKIFWFL